MVKEKDLRVTDVKSYDPEKEEVAQRHRTEEYQIFQDLVKVEPGKRYANILDNILDEGDEEYCEKIVLISTKICHAPKVQTNVEGMIYLVVEFKIPKENYKYLKNKYINETRIINRYFLGRRVTIKIFGN